MTGKVTRSFLFFAVAVSMAVPGKALMFVVDSAVDDVDAVPGNSLCATAGGSCTLRAAVQEANASAGDDVVDLPAGTYTLSLAGAGEDGARREIST